MIEQLEKIKTAVAAWQTMNPAIYVLLVGNYHLLDLLAIAEAAEKLSGQVIAHEPLPEMKETAWKITRAFVEIERKEWEASK